MGRFTPGTRQLSNKKNCAKRLGTCIDIGGEHFEPKL